MSAAGAAIAFSELDSVGEAASEQPRRSGSSAAIALLAIALIAYFAGGYVAGRMSRFDGGRQGLGVWIWSIVAVVVLAIIGAIAGSEYNLLGSIDLPRIPIDEGDLTAGGVIALVLILGGTLLAAIAGGKAGRALPPQGRRRGRRRRGAHAPVTISMATASTIGSRAGEAPLRERVDPAR